MAYKAALTLFSPDIYLDVSIEPFLALQQRLKSIGFLNLHDFVPPLDRLITMLGSMERVQSLSIRVPYLPGLPYNKTKAQNGRKILHVLKGIEKLKFSQKDQSRKARSAITEDRESGSKGDDFARLLFRNIYVGQISPRSTLRELELCSVRMKLGVGWLDVIHWSQLKFLKLKECSRVSDLLHGLADQISLSGCALQDFEFFDDYNSSTDDSSTDDSPTGYSALESFLLSFSGLRRLVLRVDKSPQAGCISQHKETLDTLEISSRGYPYQPSPADIKKICETCLELRRLALPADPRALRAPSTPVFPMTEKTSSNGFCAVLVSVRRGCTCEQKPADTTTPQDAISKLPRLRTLCFPNDPPTLGEYQHCSEDWESGEQDPEEYELYRKVLAQDLAERIFKRFALRAEKAQRQSTITMLGFSSCGGTGSDDTLYYTKGLISIRSAVSLASHKSVTAIATRPRLNRYLDSEVDEIDCIWD